VRGKSRHSICQTLSDLIGLHGLLQGRLEASRPVKPYAFGAPLRGGGARRHQAARIQAATAEAWAPVQAWEATRSATVRPIKSWLVRAEADPGNRAARARRRRAAQVMVDAQGEPWRLAKALGWGAAPPAVGTAA
jgi:hypothetical protein